MAVWYQNRFLSRYADQRLPALLSKTDLGEQSLSGPVNLSDHIERSVAAAG